MESEELIDCVYEEKENCPCRIVVEDKIKCDVYRHAFEILFAEPFDVLRYQSFVASLCPHFRSVLLARDSARTTKLIERLRKNAELIALGKIKVGDHLYCTKISEVVEVLQLPSPESVQEYLISGKQGFRGGGIKYKTKEGKVRTDALSLFNLIRKEKIKKS